jgi:hypothetical protein
MEGEEIELRKKKTFVTLRKKEIWNRGIFKRGGGNKERIGKGGKDNEINKRRKREGKEVKANTCFAAVWFCFQVSSDRSLTPVVSRSCCRHSSSMLKRDQYFGFFWLTVSPVLFEQ